MKLRILLPFLLLILMGCAPAPAEQTQPEPAPVSTDASQPNLPNPASTYCEQQGYRLEIRTAADGSQAGYCIFPDGNECDEWAYFRGECGPAGPAQLPTALPIDPAAYDQGWWTYTHPVYGFSLMLPEDWIVEQITTADPLMNGYLLNLHPKDAVVKENIRLTFRRMGEDVLLWPTGVGQGEFIEQGTLEIVGQSARRILLACPTGEVTAIWYRSSDEDQPNILRGDMEFGFIYSIGSHCEPGLSLGGKTQRVGEMIIASLTVP